MRQRKFICLINILLSFFFGIFAAINPAEAIHFECRGTANCLTGTITKVKDGDTLVLDKSTTVRLAIINTPETKDKVGWKKATDFVKKLCLNSAVKFDEDDNQQVGSYRRLVGVVYCGETKLNAALAEAGLGKAIKKYCKTSEFSNEAWAIKLCGIKNKK